MALELGFGLLPKMILIVGILAVVAGGGLASSCVQQPPQSADAQQGAQQDRVGKRVQVVRHDDFSARRRQSFRQDGEAGRTGLLRCTKGEFRSDGKCKQCTRCGHGFGARNPCTSVTDTVCERCEAGKTFSRIYSYQRACFPCGQCENREVRRKCKPNRNTSCGKCLPGWFMDHLTDRCDRCSRCHFSMAYIKMSECDVPGVLPQNQCAPLMTLSGHE